MRILRAGKKGIETAVKYLKAGKSVVYPTDTAYGLAVDATNLKAVKQLMKIKQRGKKPVHVVVSGLKMAKQYAKITPLAEKIFKKFFPGRMTLVLPLGERPLLAFGHPPQAWGGKGEVEALRLLSAGTGTIGIRMPKNRIALELSRKLGRPITTPSANPGRGLTPYSINDSFVQFANKKHQPDLYLDGGKLKKSQPSTIIKVEGKKIKILREGPITHKQIAKFLKNAHI